MPRAQNRNLFSVDCAEQRKSGFSPKPMKLLAVHPSCLIYSKIYLRLEPLGLELVAAACREAGHDVRIIDLQAETQRDYFRIIDQWQPDAVAYSCNYLAN